MSRDPAYLLDILIAARLILDYAKGLSLKAFRSDQLRQDAVMRRFEIIGEATRRISDDYRTAHPEIPWGEMIGMRNRLIHEYDEANLSIVWGSVKRDIPELIALIEPLVPPDEPDEDEQ